jgi:hypothetical protein
MILSNLILGNYEKAVQITVQYNICDIQEFRTKKCLAVFEKLLKFIKTVTYQTKWAQFKDESKKNKDLDGILKGYIEKYNTDIKVKSVTAAPPKKIEPPPAEPLEPPLKKKMVFKKKIKELLV